MGSIQGDVNCKVEQQLNPSQCQYVTSENNQRVLNTSSGDAQFPSTSESNPTQCFYASNNQDCGVDVENCGQYCSSSNRETKEKENQSPSIDPPPQSPPKSSLLLSSCV